MDTETEAFNNKRYCDMVTQYKETDGALGWPDYEQRYDKDCLIQ